MNKSWNIFCATLALFIASAQNISAQSRDTLSISLPSKPIIDAHHPLLQQLPKPAYTIAPFVYKPMQYWGVFCIGEYKLQQKTGLPLRFRLGSLEYVNRLEAKR